MDGGTMMWQEWCLVISALFITLEIGFFLGKQRTLQLLRELDETHKKVKR